MICFVSFFCSLLIHQPCLFSFDHHLVGIEAEWISRDQEALVISTSFYMILVISTWSRYQFCCKLRRRCVMTCQLVVTDEWWPTQWRIDGMQQHKKLPSWVKYLAWFPPTFASVTCMRSAEVFPLLFWSSDVVVQPYNSVSALTRWGRSGMAWHSEIHIFQVHSRLETWSYILFQSDLMHGSHVGMFCCAPLYCHSGSS